MDDSALPRSADKTRSRDRLVDVLGAESEAVDRDRDARGRPRNARPRDELGRPLPRGAAGDDRVADDLVLGPRESLLEAQRLLDIGRPFHAHEVLEAAWKVAPDSERELWKGLAQLAVGATHALRGNQTGAITLLRRGAARIASYADTPPYGIDVAGLLRSADEAALQLARGNAEVPVTFTLLAT
jgi:uncharacterized protein